MKQHVKQGDKLKAVALIRVSTDEQALGPEAQKAAIERWAETRGIEVVAWFADLGVSGAADMGKRLGLLDAVAALGTHHAGLLVVQKRDRLARDVVIAAMAERMVKDAGAEVASTCGEGEGNTPEAQLMRAMVDAFAQYERALGSARTRAALAVKKTKGELTGSVPYGKTLNQDGKTLEVSPEEAVTVARARELRETGLTIRGVVAQLEAEGFAPRLGGKFHPMQVQRMVA